MAKFGKKPTDDQMLEGGGAGSSSFAKTAGKAAEIAGITALGGYAVGLPTAVAYKADKLQKEREEAAKAKREAKKDSMTTGEKEAVQEAKDAAMQGKKDKAYNAAKTYPDNFAGGGMTASRRGDGIAQRGKTRGTLIR